MVITQGSGRVLQLWIFTWQQFWEVKCEWESEWESQLPKIPCQLWAELTSFWFNLFSNLSTMLFQYPKTAAAGEGKMLPALTEAIPKLLVAQHPSWLVAWHTQPVHKTWAKCQGCGANTWQNVILLFSGISEPCPRFERFAWSSVGSPWPRSPSPPVGVNRWMF